ncbi:7TM protein involved in diverse intracellular signaling [Mycoplasma testudineum]|uniref:7TM protein involved in diverse intracellular signaling n=2 Tax=Mycoplasma testudineum TaxID=244584 RepID=A0A4R6IC25_9MOLU|nr:7TM protein involved in diverse intracellular signaling [Mycoplasma testudineum]
MFTGNLRNLIYSYLWTIFALLIIYYFILIINYSVLFFKSKKWFIASNNSAISKHEFLAISMSVLFSIMRTNLFEYIFIGMLLIFFIYRLILIIANKKDKQLLSYFSRLIPLFITCMLLVFILKFNNGFSFANDPIFKMTTYIIILTLLIGGYIFFLKKFKDSSNLEWKLTKIFISFLLIAFMGFIIVIIVSGFVIYYAQNQNNTMMLNIIANIILFSFMFLLFIVSIADITIKWTLKKPIIAIG